MSKSKPSKKDKLLKATNSLINARAHCLWGSDSSGYDRIPDPADIQAANILENLVKKLKKKG